MNENSVRNLRPKHFTQCPPSVDLPKPQRRTLDNGKRLYVTTNGDIYPSITTIMSMLSADGIAAWRASVGDEEANRISREATERGTLMHEIIEAILRNETPNPRRDPQKKAKILTNRLIPILNRIDNVQAQEIALWSDELMVAGTCDAIADYLGVPSIIDFKSATKAKEKDWILAYFLQATAYSQMWKEHTGQEINQIVIMIAASDFSTQTFVENVSTYRGTLEETIVKYYQEKFHFDFEL